ncbi:sensor histidine kinase [Georgenia subflava]|uniref:histidine kinase n=2 Tax=Georgenia subflava TaxID=1622177 RepID=A0A6N7ELY8_9MICO|nr:sensor histidine kinase [Georgenia subflava]
MAAGVIGVAVLVGLTIVGEAQSDQLRPVLDIAAGLAAVALLPLVFRGPATAAVALAVLAALSPAATPPSTLATLHAGRALPTRRAVAVTAAATAAHVVRGLWRPMGELPFGWWVIIVVAVHAALLGWGALGRSRAQVIAALVERAERAEAVRETAEREARVQERTRIAREMHDVLAHRLSLVATYSGALEVRPDAAPEQLSRAAGVIREGTHRALEELREVVGVLREDSPDGALPRPQPGLGDVAALVEESRAAGTVVRLREDVDDAATVPGLSGRTVYRVVQEGLTNARKHAPGSVADVLVTGSPGAGLEVEVTNPLGPTPPSSLPGSSTGLVGLSERVSLAGGTLQHGVTPPGRFRLHARLPWPG